MSLLGGFESYGAPLGFAHIHFSIGRVEHVVCGIWAYAVIWAGDGIRTSGFIFNSKRPGYRLVAVGTYLNSLNVVFNREIAPLGEAAISMGVFSAAKSPRPPTNAKLRHFGPGFAKYSGARSANLILVGTSRDLAGLKIQNILRTAEISPNPL